VIPSIDLGKFRLYPLIDGYIRLDGGSLFGIVPKSIWGRTWSVDERNRIRLAVRSLLVHTGSHWILIDTGNGDKFDEKYKDIYGIEERPLLIDQIREVGISESDIHVVINSHLHWDHAGGNTTKDSSSGEWVPSFPNARYVVQRGEYEFATHLNERTKGSYRIDDYVALEKGKFFDFADGDTKVLPGVKVLRSGGHSPYHQCVLLESEHNKAFFLGDVVSTTANLAFPFISAFDLEPLQTLQKKKEYLSQAAAEEWLLFFVHDPNIAYARIALQNGRFELKR
jgi:glyoxylase-like metal-dependent hydrolase (beta-lactamase superfamily II)